MQYARSHPTSNVQQATRCRQVIEVAVISILRGFFHRVTDVVGTITAHTTICSVYG